MNKYTVTILDGTKLCIRAKRYTIKDGALSFFKDEACTWSVHVFANHKWKFFKREG